MAISEEGRRALGARIRAARGARSQTWLADQLGVSQTAVTEWERGVSVPRLDRLPDIERVLGIPDGQLVAIAIGADLDKPGASVEQASDLAEIIERVTAIEEHAARIAALARRWQ